MCLGGVRGNNLTNGSCDLSQGAYVFVRFFFANLYIRWPVRSLVIHRGTEVPLFVISV